MLNRSNMACVAILLAFLPCFTQGAQPAAQSQVAFTPTLAFLRNPELFAAAKAQFGKSVVLFNEPLIKPVLHNEVRFGRTHVPFYHGQNMVHRLYQDFLQELYQELHQTDLKDFTFLRFWHERGGVDQKSAQEFIDVHEAGNNHRNWSDGEKPLARKILSVNYSLFGNVTGGSCSFSYFTGNSNNVTYSVQELAQPVFDYYKFNQVYVERLAQLSKHLDTRQGNVCQIFIPRECVDQCVYVSQPGGTPQRSVINGVAGYDVNKNRYTQTMPLVQTYCTHPASIKSIEGLQARLVFVPDIMLNPARGVKVFRYTMVADAVMQEYRKQLRALCQEMVAEWRARVQQPTRLLSRL